MAETLIESSAALLNELGLFVGMGDVYLAEMTTEDTAATPPVYGTPYLAVEGISCGLTPVYAEGSLNASDKSVRSLKMMTGMDVAMESPRVLPKVRCHVLGREMDENGGELVGDGMPPLMAVGVYATRDDGTYLMRWIYKVRFSEGKTDMKTGEDGTIAYQIPTLEGKGVRLAYRHKTAGGKTVRLTEYVYDSAKQEEPMTPEEFFSQVRYPWAAPAEAAATTGEE